MLESRSSVAYMRLMFTVVKFEESIGNVDAILKIGIHSV